MWQSHVHNLETTPYTLPASLNTNSLTNILFHILQATPYWQLLYAAHVVYLLTFILEWTILY